MADVRETTITNSFRSQAFCLPVVLLMIKSKQTDGGGGTEPMTLYQSKLLKRRD